MAAIGAALVRGASYGVGAATALALARAGYDVAVTATKVENLASTVPALESCGRHVLATALDLRSIGAEIDLMAFFISRYFGLKAYGKIYGLMFMIFNIGTGLGPALSGRAFDRFHSYYQVLIGYEFALALTCVLLLGLGKYAYPAVRHTAQPAAQ